MQIIEDLYEEPDYEQEAPVFDDPQQADRALWHLRKIRTQLNQDESVARSNLDAIQAWLNNRREAAERQEQFWISSLESYHRARLDQDPKAKTLKFPNGTLKARVGTQPVIDLDKDVVFEYVKKNRPEFIRETINQALDVAGLKKEVEPDELGTFPGVTINPPQTTFAIDTELETEES